MPWGIVLITLGVVLALLAPFALLYLRRRWLTGQGGLFDCAWQLHEDAPGGGWVLGVARYRGETLEWFRAFSLSLRPAVVLHRFSTSYVHQRIPQGVEAIALFDDSPIVTVRDRVTGKTAALSLAREEVLALLSWLESAPPGSYVRASSPDSPPGV